MVLEVKYVCNLQSTIAVLKTWPQRPRPPPRMIGKTFYMILVIWCSLIDIGFVKPISANRTGRDNCIKWLSDKTAQHLNWIHINSNKSPSEPLGHIYVENSFKSVEDRYTYKHSFLSWMLLNFTLTHRHWLKLDLFSKRNFISFLEETMFISEIDDVCF